MGPVDLILGVHYTHVQAEEEIRQGHPFQPVAKRTKLGWYVMGANEQQRMSQVCFIDFVKNIDVERFYEFETHAVQAVDCLCPKSSMSLENRQAMELMKKSCERVNDRYLIGLPWHRSLAETQLRSLEKSLSKNPEKARMYNNVIMQYVENDWATPRPRRSQV